MVLQAITATIRSADVLTAGWDMGKPAAFDVTVLSPLSPAILMDSSLMLALRLQIPARY